MLWWSFEKFKRRYVFENEKGTKVSDDMIRTYLRRVSKLSNINMDILRSIYITHRYNTVSKTANKKSELALKMRHAPDTAARAYYKIQTDAKASSGDDNEIINELKN